MTAFAKLLRHPARQAIAVHLALVEPDKRGRRRASPQAMQEALGEYSLGTIAYHVRVMADRGLISRAGERKVRGAIEHFYSIDPAVVLPELRAQRDALNRALADIAMGQHAEHRYAD